MDDMKKGTQLLEVYALEIQMHTELKNNKQLKVLYKRALDVKSAIPHPRIMGIIRECGGKMHMHERLWSDAATDFFEVSSCPATAALFRLAVAALLPLLLTINANCLSVIAYPSDFRSGSNYRHNHAST